MRSFIKLLNKRQLRTAPRGKNVELYVINMTVLAKTDDYHNVYLYMLVSFAERTIYIVHNPRNFIYAKWWKSTSLNITTFSLDSVS